MWASIRSSSLKESRRRSAALAVVSSRAPVVSRPFSAEKADASLEWKTFGDLEHYRPAKYKIQTFNKISHVGLAKFPSEHYDVLKDGQEGDSAKLAHAILLRSHKLKEEQVSHSVHVIARCGAGTNNIPVARMTELGIPVLNTPGANANAVKELVICGMFLGSRRVIDGINHMRSLGQQGLARERVEKDKSLFGGREVSGKTMAVIGLGHIGAATARDATALGMKVQGYDPGLSVQSALKLPRTLQLSDSIISAVRDADYISLNIPYIKGTPDQGGTHGLMGPEVIEHFKPNAVLLNFARGELVDSEALKVFLDGEGRYVSDFPNDVLWNHKNVVLLPHLGASTNEAEDAAAAMAAETIRDFLETGTIKNSVNFPSTSLPDCPGGSVRFTVVNENIPGMLSKITDCFAAEKLNILQQINHSRGPIAYTVMDIDTTGHDDVLGLKKVQEHITMLDGVLSSRIIYGWPGAGLAKNVKGQYWV